MESYKNLTVWKKSIDLVEKVYSLTNQLPKEKLFVLASQMRRAAVSIPSNIAEGSRRKDLPEYVHFLRVSNASAAELETQILISKRIYPKLDTKDALLLLEEIQKMLWVLISKLKPTTYHL